METRTNSRGYPEDFVTGRHLLLDDLRRKAYVARVKSQYIFKCNIPPYPRPEFRVSYLKHDTDQRGLRGIHESGGLRGLPFTKDGKSPSVLWWSLVIKPEDMEDAERRFVAGIFPERTEEQAKMQPSFLEKFATSPTFWESSRIGSYRFTFPVEELLKAYREQFCCGAQPMMRIFETVLYKQKVMYVVLIHRPEHQEMFSQYPLLPDDPGAICTFKDGRFVWRSQAMCETHRYQYVRRPEEHQIEVVEVRGNPQFYVWDNVSLAFHIESTEVLKFDAECLKKNITTCTKEKIAINPASSFDHPLVAEAVIKQLWPISSEDN